MSNAFPTIGSGGGPGTGGGIKRVDLDEVFGLGETEMDLESSDSVSGCLTGTFSQERGGGALRVLDISANLGDEHLSGSDGAKAEDLKTLKIIVMGGALLVELGHLTKTVWL